jgi:hypothetical protein
LLAFKPRTIGIGVWKYGVHPGLDDLMRAQGPDKGYVRLRDMANPDYDIQVSIEVTISETGILKGKPVIAALRDLAGLADRIIGAFTRT